MFQSFEANDILLWFESCEARSGQLELNEGFNDTSFSNDTLHVQFAYKQE